VAAQRRTHSEKHPSTAKHHCAAQLEHREKSHSTGQLAHLKLEIPLAVGEGLRLVAVLCHRDTSIHTKHAPPPLLSLAATEPPPPPPSLFLSLLLNRAWAG
jgi:hypothetical protein